jgi:hypothetical protein
VFAPLKTRLATSAGCANSLDVQRWLCEALASEIPHRCPACFSPIESQVFRAHIAGIVRNYTAEAIASLTGYAYYSYLAEAA